MGEIAHASNRIMCMRRRRPHSLKGPSNDSNPRRFFEGNAPIPVQDLSPMLLNSAKFHEITDSVIFLSSAKLVEWPIVTPVKNCVEVIQLSCPSPIIIKSCGRLMIVPISSRVSSHARSVSSFPPAMLPGVPVSKTCHRLSTQRLLRHASSSREAWRSLRR